MGVSKSVAIAAECKVGGWPSVGPVCLLCKTLLLGGLGHVPQLIIALGLTETMKLCKAHDG